VEILYVEGDLFSAREDVVAHGCNAMGRFGSGFAGQVAERMPWARDAYMAAHAGGRVRPGAVIWARDGGRAVANCITQRTYGRSGLHVDYRALRECMRRVNAAGRDGSDTGGPPQGFARIAMPTLGIGLGGGEWGRVSEIIEGEMTDVLPVVYYLRKSRFIPPERLLPGL